MDYKKIILGVVIIVILIFLYYWIFNDAGKKTLFRLKDANTSQPIDAKANVLPSSIFSWSFWVYVKEYTTKFSENKDIILITNGATPKKNLSIYLEKNVNNLVVTLATGNGTDPTYESTTVERFPIQKWTHVLVSHRNRAVDVYIDGKIVKSTVFAKPYVAPTDSQTITINPAPNDVPTTTTDSLRTDGDASTNAGYNGFLATMQYFARAVQPEEAYAIYKAGYNGGNWLSDLFNKYRLKIAFMEDSNEINSFVL